MKRLLVSIVITFSISLTYSTNIKFYNVNDLYGVSMRQTASVCKDKNDFIWTSSTTGIMRLSGNNCRIYSIPYQTTDIINVKLVYKNNLLIAYTNNGQVFCYNEVYDRFDFLFHLSRYLKNRHLVVFSTIIDNQGDLWVSSTMGLHKYHKGEITQVENQNSELRSIEYDENHFLFIKGDEIRLMDTNTQTSKCIYKNNVLLVNQINTPFFYDAEQNKLWMGATFNSIYNLDLSSKVLVKLSLQPSPKQPIQVIKSYTDSTLLVGIDGQGIWEISKNNNRVLNIYKVNVDDPYSLKGNGVYDIFCDTNGRVWVCTFTGGLSFFDRVFPSVNQIMHQINNPNSLGNDNVNKVIEDRHGNLWFATDDGICNWNIHSNKWKNFYQNNQEQAHVFLSLCEDNDGKIWAGTYSSGIYVIDENSGKEIAHYTKGTKNYKFSSDFVFDIYKEKSGNIWLGGVMGDLVCYIPKEKEFKSYQSLPAYAFTELPPSHLLAACTFGLCSLNLQNDSVEILQDGYLLQDILVKDENVWMCTSGDGLVRFNLKNKTTEKFTVESGLSSNFVNSIIEYDGFLWLGTENGLCRFNPQNKSIQTYTSSAILNTTSFNHSARYKLRDGRLAFGTNKGAILFNPKILQEEQPQGKIFFQDIIISGRSIRENSAFSLTVPIDSLQNITLKYSQNNLTMELLSLGTSILGSKFSWKMTGLDKEWNQPSNHDRLTYTNIPTGNYTLELRMYDSSLSQIISERQLVIHVKPPFWESGWFRFMTFVFIASIVYFSLRFYINKLKQRHTEDKVKFFANTAHEVRTALTLIKAPIEELNEETNLSEQGKYYLSLASEQAGRLNDVATQLLDFQKIDIGKGQLSLNMIDIVRLIATRCSMFESIANSRNIKLKYTFTPSDYQTAIDESMMEKVIDNLISNAIKYSHPGGLVQISFTGAPQKWTMEVKDQGIGISPKAQKKLFNEFYRSENAINSKTIGSGIGLLLVKNYVSLHNGTIDCISQENVGSTFKITVPYKEISKYNVKKISSLSPQIPVINKSIKHKDLHLLIVEDNDDLRNFMLYALRETFVVSVATDGMRAWEQIRQQKIDLVISDVIMPNMNGFELCRLIKSAYETSHIPIILLTSLTEKAQQLQGLGLGADDYLTKPFDMTLLISRIMSIIQNRITVREKALKLIDENDNSQILSNELNDKFVKQAIEIIRANIANPDFGKDEFASAMNVSSSLLYKKIKSFTDQSPTNFIKTIRLNYALELLQTSKYSVTEVSELCGFSDVSYFSKTFKQYFGKTPTEV